MKIVEYDPSRRGELADLLARVWGGQPDPETLTWFYERSPVRPASVMLAEEDGIVVGTVGFVFAVAELAGREQEIAFAVNLATDPAYERRGIFRALQAANEERVAALGIEMIFTVPTAASTPVLVDVLGWQRLAPLRVWARPGALRRSSRAVVARFGERPDRQLQGRDRLMRDDAWLNWRFADGPRHYTLVEGDGGYGVAGSRGAMGFIAAAESSALRDTIRASSGRVLAAAPPAWERRSYAAAGFVPTTRRFTVLGKSISGSTLVAPHFDLGDLDFL